jgi:pyruvate dehydrogenase E1 component beta subunit
MVIIEKAPASACIEPRIAYHCQKRFFDYLDAPIVTVGGADVPIPVSRVLETASVPNIADIKKTINMAARRLL